MPRLESDSLGALDVPDEAYYGVQTLRALENFPITGQRIHPSFIHALGHVKAASIEANHAIGHLPIIQAAASRPRRRWRKASGTSIMVDPIQGGRHLAQHERQ